MTAKILPFALSCAFVFLFCGALFAQPVSSTELIDSARLYDGKTIVYEGEAIGDVMARGKFAWVNLNDGQNAIGVWMPGALAKEIRLTGSHKARGDWAAVSGVFHRACVEHGGDLDIHAQALRVVKSGEAVVERIDPAKRNLFFALTGILCLILILKRFKRT